MKITFNNTIFSNEKTGGISRYFICLIKELIKYKIDIKVLSSINKNKFLKSLPSKYSSGLYISNYPLFKFIESYNLNRFNDYIKKQPIDIIHDTYYTPGINKQKKIKKIITVHDLIHEKFPNYYRNSKEEINKKKDSFIGCDHFICVSNNTKIDLLKYYKIDSSKVSVIHHGANHLEKISYNLNSRIENPYILYVGKRHKYKNFIFFLKAYAKSTYINENFKLVCFGGGTFSKNEKKLFNELKISKKIIYINGDDKLLSSYYSFARSLIVPSIYEGFGLPIVEAMNLGCPVFCSNIEVFKEICGENAIFFDPVNEDDLIYKLENYLFKDTYLKKCVEEGQIISKKFSWSANSLKTIDVYKKLIATT